MQKHKFNIFPEMAAEEYAELVNDIDTFGFDETQPITVYEGAVLDGWNRFRACEELDIEPVVNPFFGNATAAINFVMRTNKRRNLTSQQWAAIAADADELVLAIQEATEQERRFKQSATRLNSVDLSDKKLSDNLDAETNADNSSENFEDLTYEIDEHANKTATKIAEQFNTNRSYYNKAKKLKEKAPEKFEQLKKGETTFQAIEKEAAKKTEIATEENDSFDNVTRIAKQFGNKFQSLIREFKKAQSEMYLAFKAENADVNNFAPLLTKLKFDDADSEAYFLKRFVKCPACAGSGCQYCGEEFGYVHDDQVDSIKDMASYTGVTFADYMEAKNAA